MKYLEANKDNQLNINQIVHVKLLVRAFHKIYKKSDKKGQDFLPIFETLINKLSKLEVKVEEQPTLRDPRKR